MADSDHDRLVRIEEKLDLLLLSDSDKENRLRSLEAEQNQTTGSRKLMTAATGAIGGLVGGAITYLLRK